MRYGYHLHHVLVTDCLKANQGKKSHKDVEATIIHHFNTYTNITALLSGVTTIDNPAARNWYLDVTSTNPMGVTNQEFINRAALGYKRRSQRNTILATTSSPAQSARRSASTPSTTPSARQQGRSCHLSSSKRRAGTVPPARRCTCS